MIGFSSLSNAAGMACVSFAAENQLNSPSTERRQTSPNLADSTLSEAESEVSSGVTASGPSPASQAYVTRATVDRRGQDQLEQAPRAGGYESASMLKATARQFRDFVLRTRVGRRL